MGYVYAAGFECLGLVKIGISKDPKTRIYMLENKFKAKASMVYISDYTKKFRFVEKDIHRRLYEKKFEGEFFIVEFLHAVRQIKRSVTWHDEHMEDFISKNTIGSCIQQDIIEWFVKTGISLGQLAIESKVAPSILSRMYSNWKMGKKSRIGVDAADRVRAAMKKVEVGK